MARSSISGFLLGTVVAVGGMAAVSVLQTLNTPIPEAANVNVPAGSGFDGAREDVATSLPAADPVETTTEATRADAPAPEDTAGIQGVETTPATAPETGTAEVALSAPASGSDSPDVASAADETPRATAPSLPSASADAPVTAVPARPSNPEVGDSTDRLELAAVPNVDSPDLPVREAAQPSGAAPSALTADTPESQPSAVAPLPSADVAGDVAEPQASPETSAPDAPVVNEDTAPNTATAARPQISEEREPAVIVAIPTEEAPKRPALPKVGEAVSDAPRIGTPASRLTDRTPDSTAEQATPEPAPEQPPLEKFAADFSNPDNKPLMSIVLIDRGDSDIGLEALAAFPYPLSFAVDVTSPEARARMERYRAAGFDVLALSDIPLGATGADTETLLRAGLRELPEAVAVMEGDGTGLQSDKAVSDQVTAVLQESGHGVVFFAKGLNTAQKLASKNGVAATTVFRDFDNKGQSAVVMRRFLDQAAFKARQQPGGVVMVGRLQAETISALLLWGLQDRATRVALAPISALLQATQN